MDRNAAVKRLKRLLLARSALDEAIADAVEDLEVIEQASASESGFYEKVVIPKTASGD